MCQFFPFGNKSFMPKCDNLWMHKILMNCLNLIETYQKSLGSRYVILIPLMFSNAVLARPIYMSKHESFARMFCAQCAELLYGAQSVKESSWKTQMNSKVVLFNLSNLLYLCTINRAPCKKKEKKNEKSPVLQTKKMSALYFSFTWHKKAEEKNFFENKWNEEKKNRTKKNGTENRCHLSSLTIRG